MRKFVGLLCAAALMTPAVAIVSASPAAAAGGITCTKASGTFKFTPPLPKTGTIKGGKLTSKGTVSGCKGVKGITKGTTTFTSAPSKTKSGCSTLLAPDPKSKGTKGTFTIKWNNGKVSKSTAFFVKQTSAIVDATTKGKLNSGYLSGKTASGTVTFKINNGACTTKNATGGTYTNKKGTKFTVK